MSEDLETIIREVYNSYGVRYGNAIVDLKQRIDKAIEYIEQNVNNCDIYCDGCIPKSCPDIRKIVDILKGSDKK